MVETNAKALKTTKKQEWNNQKNEKRMSQMPLLEMMIKRKYHKS